MSDSALGWRGISRRSFLSTSAVAVGGAAVASLTACGGGGSSSAGGGSGTSASYGSNKDPGTQQDGINAVFAAAKKATGVTVTVNNVDHNTFQSQINNYLQATPQNFFSWGASYRMRDLASKNLVENVDDVWASVSSQYGPGIKDLITADDGHQYYVPFDINPWVMYYRKSVWQKFGYQIPKTLDEFTALAAQMKKDGLTPIAFADKDGWPALAWFDYLNMRINGYQFHMDLLLGKQSWTDQKVKNVFDTWRSLLPYCESGPLGLTWQQSAATMLQKKSGMCLQSGFLVSVFSGADLDDLDAFNFPEVDSAIGSDAIEAPIEGFMVAKRGIPHDSGITTLMKYLATAEPQGIYTNLNPPRTPLNLKADTTKYSPLQKRLSELVGGAKSVSQYMDVDGNPTFVSTVMYPAIQKFIGSPNDFDGLLSSVEKQKQSIYGSG